MFSIDSISIPKSIVDKSFSSSSSSSVDTDMIAVSKSDLFKVAEEYKR